jgi:hypothetical protein
MRLSVYNVKPRTSASTALYQSWVLVQMNSLAQQYIFNLMKHDYMFQLCSHNQAYLQSLVVLYVARQVIVDRSDDGCVAETCSLFY